MDVVVFFLVSGRVFANQWRREIDGAVSAEQLVRS
jgi:peptidoglycan/LPS O-acetylase OafA/YrhL